MANERMEAAIKELQETAIVTAHIQARHSAMRKEHIEWLHSHDLAMAEIRKAEAERGKAIDERIAALVSGIGEFMRK